MLRDDSLADPGLWLLDPEINFLNHGSFGACPREVLVFQAELRDRLERQPVTFLVREIERELDLAREALAGFLDAEPAGLVFVPNATTGVNTVLRSLEPELRADPGCELLVTDQEYNACRNALEATAERTGAKVVVAALPFPCSAPKEVVDALLGRVTERTRLVLIDHVVSQTGMVLPIGEIVEKLNDLGVESLIDGAHGPGMVEVNLRALGATYYTGNCHKWMCAPKVAGFLWVGEDRREVVRPLVTSHGANAALGGRSRFHAEFDWTGTFDPSAYLSVAKATEVMGGLLHGGWDELRAANRDLAVEAQEILCGALGIDAPCPEEMLGSMVTVPIPDSAVDAEAPSVPMYVDPLQNLLLEKYGIEVPIFPWPGFPQRVLRVSCQAYNSSPQYVKLALALKEIFG
ncbi:MAG: isopenicillin-N epimerase [Verrucomicrobiales bacterium]|jgi:isopenicillin-N epimerase